MDADDPAHDVFSSDYLWKKSTLFQDAETYESSLFAPLELDSKSRRVCFPQTTRPASLTIGSLFSQIRPPICAET